MAPAPGEAGGWSGRLLDGGIGFRLFRNFKFNGLFGSGTLLTGELGQHMSNARTHLVTMENHVDCAMLQQELTALEPFRQLFTHGLFDDSGTGETNQRIRLGNIQITQHGQTG